jgi:serine protease AprX
LNVALPRPAHRTVAALATAALTLVAVGSGLATASPAAAVTAPSLAPVSPALSKAIATLPAMTPYGAYVNVRGGSAADRAQLLTDHGLNVVKDFPSVGVVYGTGALGAIVTLRRAPSVSYVSTDSVLKALDDSSGWATRVEQVQRAVGNGPYRDASGHIIDGAGIGVAVVDSGIDGTHPDLASRVVRNTKFKCTTPVLQNTTTHLCFGPVVKQELPNTDPSSGHGSHIAGIVAGDGTASKGTFHGVAPGASLYGYSVGDGDSIWNFDVAAAYQDILDTNAAGTNTPRIRIATNSWGNAAGSAYDPNDVVSLLVKQLISNGVTVLFAAGNGDTTNNGGTGSDDRLSSTAKDPTPGVITVANYDDAGTGTRNGLLDPSSSRGHIGVPTEYPDLSAPGSSITSTCMPTQAICATGAFFEWEPYYQVLSGTSMATPHVAGIVALLLEARPSLTPAAIENLLQDTAYKFGSASTYEPDPQNPGGTTSFDKGAGLADAQAALDALGVAHDGGESTQGQPQVAISSPADGATNNGTTPLSVTGTASDGYVAPRPFVTQVVASGDGGDLPSPLPGVADVTGLSVIETPTGMRYSVSVRDLSDAGPLGGDWVVRQTLAGQAYATEVLWDGTAASPSTSTSAAFNNAPATAIAADLATNTVSFTVPFASLGNPGPMSAAIKVFVQSYQQLSVDLTPGGVLVTSTPEPEYGAYGIRRPSLAGPPITAVTLALDSGTPQAVSLNGTSPSYTWGTSVDTTGLADGTHTLTATVLTDGIARSTRTVAFTVQRPVVVVSGVAVTSPSEGATVDRAVVPMTGTSTSNAPAGQLRAVTVQVTGGGFDSGQLTATGVDSWSLPFDFGAVAGGSYLVTARFTLDGVVAATSTRTVLVPVAAVLVSCAPRALTFWQNQYNGSTKAVFTTAEANALADKAVTLSSGYFGSRSALISALYAKGKLPAETSAAKQYAPLLLNLAAGQLSATMSTQLGLTGQERLDGSVYDTSRLGSTVASAASWMRGQFNSLGDLAGVEQAAININNRTGLVC